jgi:hypothetical protein
VTVPAISPDAVEVLAGRYYGRMAFDQSHHNEEAEATAAMNSARKQARFDLEGVFPALREQFLGEVRKCLLSDGVKLAVPTTYYDDKYGECPRQMDEVRLERVEVESKIRRALDALDSRIAAA